MFVQGREDPEDGQSSLRNMRKSFGVVWGMFNGGTNRVVESSQVLTLLHNGALAEQIGGLIAPSQSDSHFVIRLKRVTLCGRP